MSYHLNSKCVFDAGWFFDGNAGFPIASETSRRTAEEHLLDSALRNVQLPDGLLTRLGKLVYTIQDETADQVDWLGC